MPLSRTEFIARALLKHYLPKERFVYGLRPDWLKNPETGRNLEVDIWMPERKIGVEVQGVHHGRPTKGLQKDFAAFEKQQRHDLYKHERFKELGYTLHSLNIFDLTQPRFAPFLMRLCATHGLKIERYIDTPHHLFAEAERLSRAKVVKRPYRKPGLIPLIRRWLKRRA